ncbi:Flp pilus assembly protein CpaB [Novosphingobium tardum]|uniref:Flp pilus assembly protein CpaB n=1 Tax=Novosphingobium tardum TaxID=1538021 RepID=A0ABV8RKB9_9SPHN
MGGQRNLIILGIAIVLGLFAVLFANSYFSGVERRQAQVAQEQQLARIVVASQPLAFGSKLTPDNLKLANWPASSVPVGAFSSLEQAMKDGRVALRPIVPGEPVLADKVSGTDGRATLAANLPEGMRAVSIPISNVTGVSGFALPGTTVDVLLTRQIPGGGSEAQDIMSDVVLENKQILAIDQLADEKTGEPKVGATATLQVDLLDAQKLAVAQKIGTLSLALRNVENQVPGALTTVTAADLGGARLYKAARSQPAPAAPAPTFLGLPAQFSAALAGANAARKPVLPRIMGNSMTVIRGTESADYPVGNLGGR